MSATTEITAQRTLLVKRPSGTTRWQVTEFDGGEYFMLVALTGSTQFQTHFTREQWTEFQQMVGEAVDE